MALPLLIDVTRLSLSDLVKLRADAAAELRARIQNIELQIGKATVAKEFLETLQAEIAQGGAK
jgi:hypothetical protein